MQQPSIAHAIIAGLVAAFVGFASSFPVVLKGLIAIGASDAQAASGLMALSIAMGVAGITLSLWTRMPVSVAWSTPGAALMASTGAIPGGFPAAVGAFLIVGLLSIIPTREFLSWSGAIKAGQVPVWEASRRKRVAMIIHAELAAVVIILLCAAIMARGGWV